MTASPTPPGATADRVPPRQQSREVLAAVFHAAAAEPDVALLVVELRNAAARPVVRWSNDRAAALVQSSVAAMEARALAELVVEPHGPALAELFHPDRPTTTAVTMRSLGGGSVTCRVTTIPAPDGRLWTLHAVPAQSALELALRNEVQALEHRFTTLADRSPVPTLMSEQGLRLGHVNDAFCALLDARRDQLLGTGWTSFVQPDDLDRITDAVVAVLAGEERDVRSRFVDAHGRVRYTELRFTPLHTPGLGDAFVATVEDITRTEEPTGRHASHDALTGLPHRGTIRQHLAELMDASEVGPAAMVLDLDGLKQVNDSLGRRAGDALLVEVARRLAVAVPPGDMVGRLDGDEFVVACASGSIDAVLEVADNLLRAVSEPLVLGGVEVHPRASIGVVQRGPGHHSADELVRDGDIAMYQAKARGKGRINVLDQGSPSEVYDTLNLVSDLRQAIEQRRITVCYQPIVRQEEAGISLVGVEALARWTHPARGPIPPDVFVRLAEQHGLGDALGALVLETACAALADWQRELGAFAPAQVHVNVSPRQLRDELLAPTVRRTLQRFGLRPHGLCLEVRESALTDEPELAALRLGQLREHGVKVAIDDFGTGYSSLAHLHQLPVDYLKVDRTFVAELEHGDAAVAQAAIALARGLEIDVVAEGVETAAQADLLAAMDCSLLQGFGILQPLVDEEFVAWCRSGYPLAKEGAL